MSKTKGEASSAAAAMQTIASDGYLAFIEWPVFLTNRLKQVEQHLTVTAGHDTPAQTAAPTLPIQAAAFLIMRGGEGQNVTLTPTMPLWLSYFRSVEFRPFSKRAREVPK